MQPASVVMHIECEAKCEVLPWPVIYVSRVNGVALHVSLRPSYLYC